MIAQRARDMTVTLADRRVRKGSLAPSIDW
jgi:hypothetical protein